MKIVLIFVLHFIFCSCYSQESNFKFPNITNHANTLSGFIPSGWKIVDSVSSDFNKDGLKDIAMVISTIDSIQVQDTDCDVSSEPYYAKMLIIVFRNLDNTFKLSITNTKLFGDCNWGIQESDPYDKIFVRRNSFGIEFSTGGTLRENSTYFFSYLNHDWFLIGESSFEYWAGHDGSYSVDINLQTGIKISYEQSGIGSGKKTHYKKIVLGVKPLKKMQDFNEDIDSQLGE